MAQPAENYVPQNFDSRHRRQAVKSWALTTLVVFSWVAVIAAAPLFAAAGSESVSGPIYNFFSYLCHQMPDRSLHLASHQLAVCSRCFGVYFGLFAGLLAYPLWRPIDDIEPLPRIWLFLSLVPIGTDWALTAFDIWENTHASRFVTGLILGFACATYIVPAVVEITRNMTSRPRPASRKV